MPDDVTGRELDREVRAELKTLPLDLADTVARHLVMVARLLDDDPELAYRHARAIRDRASRVAVAREAAGLAAYRVGKFADALSELRAYTRMSGSQQHLPIMADCERGLGRPDKALAMAVSPAAKTLDVDGAVELRIVASGARHDLGQLDAAVVTLQCKELNSKAQQPWVARLRYAYADALLAVDRVEEARTWFVRAVEADVDSLTDADERLAALDGIEFVTELDDDDLDGEWVDAAAPADGDAARETDAPDEVDEPQR